ncbi:MAG TPA: DUF3455 domain-containing protein [Acidobacteriaceae bacterium]|nr:DUF3455 domain-containing protein [Acidobacteriaceae bacterium]
MFSATATLLTVPLLFQAATVLNPPDLTLPPETAQTVTILEGRGDQIYTCAAQGAGYAWLLKAPDARLFNLATGKAEGHHDIGPTWTLDDGSSVRGTVLQKKAGDTPADVPWLLLKAEPANTAGGTLSGVTYVRRYNTHGGAAPATGCTAQHAGEALKVPYTATYAFYAVPR